MNSTHFKVDMSPSQSKAEIDKVLLQNYHLINTLIDLQAKGKLQECAQFQWRLHKNLIYMAIIGKLDINYINKNLSPPVGVAPFSIVVPPAKQRAVNYNQPPPGYPLSVPQDVPVMQGYQQQVQIPHQLTQNAVYPQQQQQLLTPNKPQLHSSSNSPVNCTQMPIRNNNLQCNSSQTQYSSGIPPQIQPAYKVTSNSAPPTYNAQQNYTPQQNYNQQPMMSAYTAQTNANAVKYNPKVEQLPLANGATLNAASASYPYQASYSSNAPQQSNTAASYNSRNQVYPNAQPSGSRYARPPTEYPTYPQYHRGLQSPYARPPQAQKTEPVQNRYRYNYPQKKYKK